MCEHVLSVAGAELESPNRLHELGVETVDPAVEARSPSFLCDGTLHLLLGLFHELLDSGWVDASVLDQLVHGSARHLPSDAIKARDHDHAGRVVHDDVNAGRLLEGTDIPTLAADNAALHLITRELDRADQGFRGVVGSESLDCGAQHATGSVLGLFLGVGRLPAHELRALPFELVLQALQQHIGRLLA